MVLPPHHLEFFLLGFSLLLEPQEFVFQFERGLFDVGSQLFDLRVEQVVQFHCLLVVLLQFGRPTIAVVGVGDHAHSADS